MKPHRFPPAALRAALHLYAITPDALPDVSGLSDFPASLAAAAAAAIDGGVTAIQYRDKSNRPIEERATIARRLAALCGERNVLFIINDDAELAVACGADGVHLGPHDASISEVKARHGDRLIVGASAGEPGRALELVRAGADYLGVGAIYDAHGTKADASAPRGPAILRAFREIPGLEKTPIVAIGGITAATAGNCIHAGADGVAVTRAILGSADPEGAARAFSG